MSVKDFENKRWEENKQKTVFRHKEALRLIDSGKILDVGCGDGLFLKMLESKGLVSIGVDISEEGIAKCKGKNLNALLCDFSSGRLPFPDNEFDYVVMLDVLEHLYAPEDLFKEAKRVSKEYIIISIPNFNSLPARIQMFLGKVPENNRPNKGHIFWFNFGVFKKMLKDNNLKQVSMEVNTFWENNIVFGKLMNLLALARPSIFALSFIVKLKTYEK